MIIRTDGQQSVSRGGRLAVASLRPWEPLGAARLQLTFFAQPTFVLARDPRRAGLKPRVHLAQRPGGELGEPFEVDLAEPPAAVQSFRTVLIRNGRSRVLADRVVSSLGSVLAEAMANGRVARNAVRE